MNRKKKELPRFLILVLIFFNFFKIIYKKKIINRSNMYIKLFSWQMYIDQIEIIDKKMFIQLRYRRFLHNSTKDKTTNILYFERNLMKS